MQKLRRRRASAQKVGARSRTYWLAPAPASGPNALRGSGLDRLEERGRGRPGPLDRKTEAALAVAIVVPALAAYAAVGYALYEAISGSL